MSTQWTIEGVDLRNLAHNIRSTDGWDSWPGRRGQNETSPYVHGESAEPRKFYPGRDLSLAMTILDTNAVGGRTLSPIGHVEENIDKLLGLLHKTSGFLEVSRTRADGSVRTVYAESAEPSDISEGIGAIDREFLIRLRLPDPFWRTPAANSPTTQANILSTSQAFNVTTGGNAPIADAIIRFTANSTVQNPRIEWTPPGFTDLEYIQYPATLDAGDWIEFDCRRRIAVLSNGDRVAASFSFPWWIELHPSTVHAFTATCTAASDWDVDVTWFDKYF